MKTIRRLFGQKDDPLMERADTLVYAANMSAIGTLVPMLDKFPFLRDEVHSPDDVKHFDFVLTVAGVFIAATRLRNLRLGESREEKLMKKVSERLTEWNPTNGIRSFEHCKSFFERNYDALANSGHEPRFVASDAIGLWVVWDVLRRAPESEEEWRLVRTVGAMVTYEFFDWWDEKA